VSDLSQVVRQVQSAVDIVDVVSEHVTLKRAGRNHVGLCPFHAEKTPSFSVSSDKQIFKCFGCGAGGDVIKFVQRIENVSFLEALRSLAARGGIQLKLQPSGRTGGDRETSRQAIISVNRWASEFYSSLLWDENAGKAARDYLFGRGLEVEILKRFSVGFSPPAWSTLVEAARKLGFAEDLLLSAGLATRSSNGGVIDTFRGRVMFPIHDASGNVIGFGGRVLDDQLPKYLNTAETPVFNKGRCLFGLGQARKAIQQLGRVVVVEGYTDCLACHQFGLDNVVATLGTALTDEHVGLLRRYAEQVVLLFDADQAGQRAAERALEIFLGAGVEVKLASTPGGTDPFDLLMREGRAGLESVLNGAVSALEFRWNQTLSQFHDLSGAAAKRAAIEQLLRAVAACAAFGQVDAIQRGLVVTRLANLLSVPAEQLAYQLQRLRRRLPLRTRYAGGDSFASPLPEPQSATEAAYRELLEVLLAEPGYVAAVKDLVKPAEFSPQPLDRIAGLVWKCFEELGEFTLAELLGYCPDAGLSDVITELQASGVRRGNFARTVEDAIRCIEQGRGDLELQQLTSQMMQSGDRQGGDDEVLLKLYERLRERRPRSAALLGGQ